MPEPQKPASRTDKLLEEIGIFDSETLPPGYKPSRQTSAGGMFIRGAQGSHWLNRLSTLILVLLGAFILGAAVLLFKGVSTFAAGRNKGPAVTTCEPIPAGPVIYQDKGQAMLSGNPKPPIIGELSDIATGAAVLAPHLGVVKIAGNQRGQQFITQLGQMVINTDIKTGVVTRAGATFANPTSPCRALAATGILDPSQRDSIRVQADSVILLNGKWDQWTVRLLPVNDKASGIVLTRRTP